MSQRSWWNKNIHQDRRPFLLTRNNVKNSLRNWFEEKGFLEVECGALQFSPGNEAHLHAFSSDFLNEDGSLNQKLYLHTSPEFACKKLLAAGEDKIFDFARVYRNREHSPTHSPEFTMLEWYRAGSSLKDMMDDTTDLTRTALEATNCKNMVWKDKNCDPHAEPEFLTLTDAFNRFANIDLESVLDDTQAFKATAKSSGINLPENVEWTDIFSAVLVSKIEHELGTDRLTFLYNYPICEAALARPCPSDPRFAERFEMYGCGVELANGFGELTDPIEQRKRFEKDMNLKSKTYGERYPIDEDFLSALAHMPEASGVALGFDRLVMVCSGARKIEDVLWTPFPYQ